MLLHNAEVIPITIRIKKGTHEHLWEIKKSKGIPLAKQLELAYEKSEYYDQSKQA